MSLPSELPITLDREEKLVEELTFDDKWLLTFDDRWLIDISESIENYYGDLFTDIEIKIIEEKEKDFIKEDEFKI